MASYFWVGSISYSSWMPNKLGCRIMVIGSTPPVFLWFYSQLPLYKIWGGTSFFVSQVHWGTRAKNYEIHSFNKFTYPCLAISKACLFLQINLKSSMYIVDSQIGQIIDSRLPINCALLSFLLSSDMATPLYFNKLNIKNAMLICMAYHYYIIDNFKMILPSLDNLYMYRIIPVDDD